MYAYIKTTIVGCGLKKGGKVVFDARIPEETKGQVGKDANERETMILVVMCQRDQP